MASLREAGIVRSERGHDGGGSLERDLATLTLRDVYAALGEPSLFALGGGAASSECLLERAVHDALGGAFRDARALMMEWLGAVTLAQIAASLPARPSARRAEKRTRR